MRQVAVFLVLLVLNLFSCDGGFESCNQKTKDLDVIRKDKLSIPITTSKSLVFSYKPLKNYIKKDSFLNLYLIKSNKRYEYPFKINRFLKYKNVAIISKDDIICTTIKTRQNSLNKFGKTTKEYKKTALILNSCCEIVGINTKKGVISKNFIDKFLNSKTIYTEFGIRVKEFKNSIYVERKNPFIKTPFKLNDKIISINDKKINKKKTFNSYTLFLNPNKKYKVKIKRKNKILTLHVKPIKRKGGGFLSDSFFEFKGIYLDENLKVISSKTNTLLKDDIIKMVNGVEVKTFKDIQKALSCLCSNNIKILVNRNSFDLFVTLEVK